MNTWLASGWVTVALFSDGSYAVARNPVGQIEGFAGFLIFDRDGTPRGRHDIRMVEDEIFVGTYRLEDYSDVPGAWDLAFLYVTQLSSKNYFRGIVADKALQQVCAVEYGMDRLPSATAGSIEVRQLAQTTNRIARARLEQLDCTLAPGLAPDGGSPQAVTFNHPWTSDQAKWAPVIPGSTPLEVVTEVLDDGSQRQVSGRYINSNTFEIVNPHTGVMIFTLHARPGPGGTRVWTEGELSALDVKYFYEEAKQAKWDSAVHAPAKMWHWIKKKAGGRTHADRARALVQHVVNNGLRPRDDALLAGYGLYRLNVNGRDITVRARVDGTRRVVRARRPTPLDERPDADLH